MSERRGREQFAAVQDRLSALADRSAAPAPLSGDDLLRAMPALSGLDARLGEILSRIQHSEASFAERLDSAKAAAQYIASQAQSSAVTAARGEMRDLESRLMHAIGDAASAGLERQQPVMAEIASLRADVANLARRFDCPVRGARAIRLPGGRFRLELTDPIPMPRDSEGLIDVDAATQAVNDVIAGWVREHPGQWLWMHRRWR